MHTSHLKRSAAILCGIFLSVDLPLFGDNEREEALTVRVVGTSKDSRTVEVIGEAGDEPMIIRAYHWKGQTWKNKPKPIVKKLRPHEKVTFTYKAKPNYEVKAFIKNKVVDVESSTKKSGL